MTVAASVVGYRLSPQQERLWSLQGDQPFRAQCAVALSGPLDRQRLRAALADTVERHPILRTAFRHLPGISAPLRSPQELPD